MENITNENVQQGQPSTQVEKKPLPKAVAVLVLGIISIATSFCYGIPGLIIAIITMVMSSGAKKLYNATPALYTESSYKNLNAGRICGIIGLILSIVMLFVYIIIFIVAGGAFFALMNR